MLRRGRVVFWPLVVAVLLVGVAGAATSASIGDPAGDEGSGPGNAPDITSVSVLNDGSGTLTFRVIVANRPQLLKDDELCVNLDLDQNPDSGSMFYGADVAFCYQRTALTFQRPDGAQHFFQPVTAPPSFRGTFNPGVATFYIKTADLRLATTSGFNLTAESHSYWPNGPDYTDSAPDLGTVNYQPGPGTQPPPLGPDTRPPFDQAFTAHGMRGKIVDLKIQSADGRGVSADTFRVYQGNHLLITHRYSLQRKSPFRVYWFPWHARRRLRGPLRFCVSSVDAAGNKSNTPCAAIILR
jgi:hypothetical protein